MLTGVVSPSLWRNWLYEVGEWFLNSPMATFYRLSMVTIGLSLTVLRLVTDRQTDRRNWSIGALAIKNREKLSFVKQILVHYNTSNYKLTLKAKLKDLYYSSVTGSVTYSVTDSVMRALNGKYREGLLSAPQPEVLRPRRLNAYVGQWLCLLMRL